ncbi:hypothetical protein DIZ27_34525 [Streptomyces sp. NWU339]|nr:hypothetical protein DIZ27_34525 [Streptomyces sp. NWU339]
MAFSRRRRRRPRDSRTPAKPCRRPCRARRSPPARSSRAAWRRAGSRARSRRRWASSSPPTRKS